MLFYNHAGSAIAPMTQKLSLYSLLHSPVVLLVLSAILPGFGQLISQKSRRAIIAAILYEWGTIVLFTLTVLYSKSQWTNLLGLCVVGILRVGIILDGAQFGRRRKKALPNLHTYAPVPIILFLLLHFVLFPLSHTFVEDNIILRYFIPSSSMSPTLLTGDNILATILPYRFGEVPQQNDIITFRNCTDKDQIWCKRIAALSGDTVRVEQAQIFVNGTSYRPAQYSTQLSSENEILAEESYQWIIPKKNETIRLDSISSESFLFFASLIRQENRKTDVITELYLYADNLFVEAISLDTINNLSQWRNYVNTFQQNDKSILTTEAKVFISGKEVTHYTFHNNAYFMLGDNQRNSYDSRQFGPVSFASFTGIVKTIFFSWKINPTNKTDAHIRFRRIAKVVK